MIIDWISNMNLYGIGNWTSVFSSIHGEVIDLQKIIYA